MDVKSCFLQANGIDSFQRADEAHILDIFLGIDHMSRYTMFFICDSQPDQLTSSQMVSVFVGQRGDGRWGISFALNDNSFQDVFFHLCSDIIESSRYVPSKTAGALYVGRRYSQWQDMLSKYRKGILSETEIKGLIGEMVFLKNYLLPHYGDSAVDAWIGPEMADQDFVFSSLWYEVKATTSGAEAIRISSVEQLDIDIDGELIIVYLDKTSRVNEGKITINQLYIDILNLLKEDSVKQRFNTILLKRGYYNRSEYDEIAFQLSDISRYQVSQDFPCIRRNNVPNAVATVNYNLLVSAISSFLIKECPQ